MPAASKHAPMVDWIRQALAEIGLSLDTAPIDTVEAFRAAYSRLVASGEIQEPKAEEKKLTVRKPPSRRSNTSKPSKRPGKWRGGAPRTVHRDLEITDRQVDVLISLRNDYGSKMIALFGRGLEKKVLLPRISLLTEDHFRRLNRGQASDLIGALLAAQKAGEIEKL